MKLGPGDVLRYDARYRVLICRECQYAIQKNAIQSHLLRHKIYRGERRTLLAAIAELDIVDPDDVPLPPSVSLPIDGISIVVGYRCLVSGCGHLCASSKRMKSHHSESHGQGNLPDFDSLAQEVKLQTFFRGNKLRYFEVTPLPTRSSAINAGNHAQKARECEQGNHTDQTVHDDEESVRAPGLHVLTPDLETLRYFYHFTTETSSTLPSMDNADNSQNYWTGQIIPLALQHQYIMSGLLAISACHLATSEQASSASTVHRERSAQFSLQLFSAWEKSKHNLSMPNHIEKARMQLACILECLCWAYPEFGLDVSAAKGNELVSIIKTMREFGCRLVSSHTAPQRILGSLAISTSLSLENPVVSCPTDKRLDELHDLPSRMAEVLGKPKSVHDVLVTLDAISVLSKCCELAYSSDEMHVAWQSMVAWPAMVPEHFHNMVSGHSTPALVVVAHWVAFLVQRVEDCECWFLDGAADKMLRVIRDQVVNSQDGPEILRLFP